MVAHCSTECRKTSVVFAYVEATAVSNSVLHSPLLSTNKTKTLNDCTIHLVGCSCNMFSGLSRRLKEASTLTNKENNPASTHIGEGMYANYQRGAKRKGCAYE